MYLEYFKEFYILIRSEDHILHVFENSFQIIFKSSFTLVWYILNLK